MFETNLLSGGPWGVSGSEVVPRTEEGDVLVASALRVVQLVAARDQHVKVLRRAAWSLRVQYLLHHLLSEEDEEGRSHERRAPSESLLRQVADEHGVGTIGSSGVVNAVSVSGEHFPLHRHIGRAVCYVGRVVVPTIIGLVFEFVCKERGRG